MSNQTQPFHKYQGTGNDFIIFDSLSSISTDQIVTLCDRKFGIGADGVILMHKGEANHFDMMYYNADGSESFCGNGSRCSVMHAYRLGWINKKCTFNSNDGLHEAKIEGNLVHLKMHDVKHVISTGEHFVLNTGSPHFVTFVTNLDFDIVTQAKTIRYSDQFKEKGINVNFCESADAHLNIRTYERGVEDETLSCGTGVTAAAIAEYIAKNRSAISYSRKIKSRGGDLAVTFQKEGNGFNHIYLIGPATHVFSGEISI